MDSPSDHSDILDLQDETMDQTAKVIVNDLTYVEDIFVPQTYASDTHSLRSSFSVDNESRDFKNKDDIISVGVGALEHTELIDTIIEIPEIEDTCKKFTCDLEDGGIECLQELINTTICRAKQLLEADPRNLFLYKYPETIDIMVISATDSDITTTTVPKREWSLINGFNYNSVIGDIRDFIGQWKLSPETKCVVLSNPKKDEIAKMGSRYYVDAHFSKPTIRCPNPLPVAKVRFIVTVSDLLPQNYPVMVTYRFEGYNTLYYALGHRLIKSFSFQRFYIESIMHSKLAFFAQICECRHGTVENPKSRRKNKKPKKKNPNVEGIQKI